MTKPVCLVMGAGAGIGGNVGKRFAAEGYHAVLCRRSDEAGLQTLVDGIESSGGSATGYLLNAIEDGAIEERVAAVEADTGPIEVVVYNLGAQVGNRALEETTYKVFELGWRMATFGLFRAASVLCPIMENRAVIEEDRRDDRNVIEVGAANIWVVDQNDVARLKRVAELGHGGLDRPGHRDNVAADVFGLGDDLGIGGKQPTGKILGFIDCDGLCRSHDGCTHFAHDGDEALGEDF